MFTTNIDDQNIEIEKLDVLSKTGVVVYKLSVKLAHFSVTFKVLSKKFVKDELIVELINTGVKLNIFMGLE